MSFPNHIDLSLLLVARHNNTSVRMYAFIAAGNIAAGSKHAQMLVNGGVLPRLKAFLFDREEENIRKSCWVLSSIAGGTEHQAQA